MTRLLSVLEPSLIGSMLTVAAQDDAIAIVSHLHDSRYPAIVDATPADAQRKLHQLLDYPSHSLASMVTTGFIRVDAATPCGTFCDQLSQSTDTRPRPVLVVDAQGRYEGMISLQTLYARRNRIRPVGEVANKVEPLSGLTSAESALSSRLWLRFTELPVVDRRHRLLGVVTRASLQRVAGHDTPTEFTLDRMVGELAAGYLTLCGNLLESVVGHRR
jgi:Mg/Co/Ni transporter MgtE